MHSLKFILLFVAQISVCGLCFAQNKTIDSLQKVLYSLRDTTRIDCLNNLSYVYIQHEQKDSAEHYANLALDESNQLHYTHGVAVAYLRKATIAKHFDDDFAKSEQLGIESLRWYEKTANKQGIELLYDYLIYTVFAQSRFEEALQYTEEKTTFANQNGNQADLYDALEWKFAIYRQSGNYEKSFLAAKQRYEFAINSKNKFWISSALYSMAQLYLLIEDYPNALNYFRQILQMDDDEIRKKRINNDIDIWFKMEFSEVFSHLKQFDSAWHYYNLFKPEKNKEVYFRVYWVSTGECYLLQNDFEHALQNFKLGLAEHQKLNDRNEIMRTLLDIGKTYLALNINAEALRYGREGLTIALQTKAMQYTRDGYQILSTVYDRLLQADSANFYFRQYIIMKEAVLDNQTNVKLAAYNYEKQIALINKEKEIQQAKLENEALVKKLLIAGLVGLLLLGFIIFRNIILKRRNEKQKLQHQLELQKSEAEKTTAVLQQKATELEMQALRAQMNPHFIFNSLNAINRFILQNNKAQASEYLTKFSRLIRLILQSSQAPLIPLDNELEALQLYLDLEAVRFDHHFEFNIRVAPDLDVEALQVPPLIIQPYAENAIWHGLMHKEDKGILEIDLFEQNDFLICKITDNGIGREKALELKGKSSTQNKSMGMKITAGRITLLHQGKDIDEPIKIIDLVLPDGTSAGTEVILKIPVVYN
jgi:tetratricopeptide (TPR) repeat protein